MKRSRGGNQLGVRAITFTKRLHAGIMAGEITQTVRIWKRLHVKVGGCYGLGPKPWR